MVSFKFSYAFYQLLRRDYGTTGFTDRHQRDLLLPSSNVSYPLPSVEGLSLIGHVGYTHYSDEAFRCRT